jgi:predicted transcriptional regulator YdeE
MEVKIVQREEFIIGGLSVETTPENNDKDIEVLFSYFCNRKMQLLNNITKNTKEYYGVIWYTKLHERYKYLVGQKINSITNDFDVKILPEGQYACSKFSANYDPIKAWTDFYYKGIPEAGYKPIEKNDISFEYYPNGLNGEYELWTLVEKDV